MAPIPLDRTTIPDLSLSSLELDDRSTTPFNLPAYLSSLSLSEREAFNTPPSSLHHNKRWLDLASSSPPLSPMSLHRTLTARNSAPSPATKPGTGTIDPNNINMKGMMVLFALIGTGFVLAAIWFFFWAKNGGFVWRKGDWEDYKSTVLRRKGPNGTTLSGATKSTVLGGGSVVAAGYRDDDGDGITEMSEVYKPLKKSSPMKGKAAKMKNQKDQKNQKKQQQASAKQKVQNARKDERWEGGFDNDVRAYRHEKPARVGGLNREADGTYHGTDYESTDPSEWTPNPPRRQTSPNKKPANNNRRDFSFADNSGETFTRNSAQQPHRNSPRQPSPKKRDRASMPGSFAEPIDFSSEYLGTDNSGTKGYHHPIPGLSGNKNAGNGGFRRGGGRRRDSLSESEGEDSRPF